MSRRSYLYVPIILLMGLSSVAKAEDAPLTLQQVVEIARTRAPSTAIARARVDESRAALIGAGRLATRNPVLEASAGPHWSDATWTDVQTTLAMPLDLGGRRGKRVAVADADIRREQFEAQSVERQTVATAVAAYYQTLHADRRLALAEERVRLAEGAQTTAQQRQRAGDVAEFEVNLARGEVARALSAVAAAKSEQLRARAQLATVLGQPGGTVAVTGDLAERSMLEGNAENVSARPDLRVLSQEVEVARAEGSLARTQRWPNLDLRVSYQRDEGTDILLGGIGIAIPIFDRGQGDVAVARAREKRAQIELDTKTQQLTTQLASARASYAATVAAVGILEDQAVPLSITNETAASASYRAGKVDINTLLIIRREALDTRREHLDRLLEAALAGVELWLARGANF